MMCVTNFMSIHPIVVDAWLKKENFIIYRQDIKVVITSCGI